MENATTTLSAELKRVQIGNDPFFKISNVDILRSFFMSIVSDSNHWMFISSNGGLSAGRQNAENALFPYYTDDKITESAEITGSKSIFRVQRNGSIQVWEPFSIRDEGKFKVSRNLYKSVYGNKVLFEEINHDLNLLFKYQWSSSNVYGFIRESWIVNQSESNTKISLIDGIQNVLPYAVNSDLQTKSSNLVDAYKRSELHKSSGVGIYALSAIPVDKAEPSEALKANIVWSLGMANPKYLLSSLQLDIFRKGGTISEETDVKAEKGAYFVHTDITLSPAQERKWTIIADVNKDHADIFNHINFIGKGEDIKELIQKDVDLGTQRLIALNAASDALQLSADKLRDARHFSNALFNIMRGGIFDNNYQIEKWDFKNYLAKANKEVFRSTESAVDELSDIFSLSSLRKLSEQSSDKDFQRLCMEYMPLKFSRRHGDPSRPWNKFSINTRSEIDGSKILDYEGNWRDIFQNWEALAHSYPEFIESMIHKFLNASTFDGYNPYRVTKDGFDWETIEPDNPWSYIGYWGDHQIIYLLKFLEFIENHAPGRLTGLFDDEVFVYANVPYRIKSYGDIVKDPKDTIVFDFDADHAINQRRDAQGADGALLKHTNGENLRVNFIEKILATVLSKVSNFVPEGGIWMNTQRPEWNDANNALVGNGVSMVTLYYLRRFLKFFQTVLSNSERKEVSISAELLDFFEIIKNTFSNHSNLLNSEVSDTDRKVIVDGLGQAGSAYREQIYNNGFSGNKQAIALQVISQFVDDCLKALEQSIRVNKREDNLYHAYNLLTIENEKEISISYLSEMLEGQVAVLSSGYLSGEEALQVLDAMKKSALFRDDQYSYLLYPNKQLPGFLEKNTIDGDTIQQSELLKTLDQSGIAAILDKDIHGNYHFNGNFKNANDVEAALDDLANSEMADLVAKDRSLVLQIFEDTFNHKAFTGRSGTFYGYEGLGSIYWHMVSKLQLAVQECCLKAIAEKENEEVIGRLLEHYYEINEGIGVHKSPSLYGAFPTDPYSHTPAGKGAQQPGMTGQVKEDILSRYGELGIFVKQGRLYFDPCLLRKNEFLQESKLFDYVDVNSAKQQIQIDQGSLCFTYCQVPVIYQLADNEGVEVIYKNNESKKLETLILDAETSNQIFQRTGVVSRIMVQVKESELR